MAALSIVSLNSKPDSITSSKCQLGRVSSSGICTYTVQYSYGRYLPFSNNTLGDYENPTLVVSSRVTARTPVYPGNDHGSTHPYLCNLLQTSYKRNEVRSSGTHQTQKF